MVKRKVYLKDGLWFTFESSETTESIRKTVNNEKFITIGSSVVNTEQIQLIEEIKQ